MRTFDSDSHTAGGGSPRAVPLPEGIADTAAGAGLAAMLDGVPVQRVAGFDTVVYLKAAYRLATHYRAVFLQALLETGLRAPGPDDRISRVEVPGDFAAEEARAALVWSRSRAESTFGRAYEMFGQIPTIGAAMLDGTVDEPRANAFCDWTRGLADEHTARIIDELLPRAAKLTVSQLIDRIKRLAIALDPEWAERRYRDAVRQRRVELRQNPDGTANFSGRELPADRAKTGADRIHALAQSCKSAGDKRRIDTIRADLYLGMLDGLFQQMSDQQIIDHILAHPLADDPSDNHSDPPDHGGNPTHDSGDGPPDGGNPTDDSGDDPPDDDGGDPPDDDGGDPPDDDGGGPPGDDGPQGYDHGGGPPDDDGNEPGTSGNTIDDTPPGDDGGRTCGGPDGADPTGRGDGNPGNSEPGDRAEPGDGGDGSGSGWWLGRARGRRRSASSRYLRHRPG